MSISIMTLLPQLAASTPPGGGTSKGQSGDGFDRLLAALSGSSNKGADATGDGKQDDMSPVLGQLQLLLQALTKGQVNVQTAGLGLSKGDLDDLLAAFGKIIDQAVKNGTEGTAVLAGILASSQLVGALSNPGTTGLAGLLATGADGAISSSSIVANLQLLKQAFELVRQSGGQLNLRQALQALALPSDAFAGKLEQLLQTPAAEHTAQALSPPDTTGPPRAPDPGSGPPEGAQQALVSATAGSNGRELTPVTVTGSPADGAAEETTEGLDVAKIAAALEALIREQQAAAVSPPRHPETPLTVSVAQETPPGINGSSADQPADARDQEVAGDRHAAAAGTAQDRTLAGRSGAQGMANVQPPAGAVPNPEQGQLGTHTLSGQVLSGDQTGSGEAALGSKAPEVAKSFTGDEPAQGRGGQADSQNLLAPFSPVAPMGGQNAQPPGVTASAPPPFRGGMERAVLDQIVQQAAVALNNGQQEFRIRLKPEFLGALEVRVSVDNGVAVVRMAAQSSATQHLLQANVGQLKQAFGTTEVRVQVADFGHWDSTGTFAQGNPQGQGFWQGQQPYGGFSPLPSAVPFAGENASPAAEQGKAAILPANPAGPTAPGAVDLEA